MPTALRTKGFTLIELMVTVTIACILAILALPIFTNTIRRGHVTAASNALLASLNYARTEAVNRGIIVSICPSNADGSACSGSNAYHSNGWLIYTYAPGSGIANTNYSAPSATPTSSTTPAPSVLLRRVGALNGVSVQANGNIISFDQQGKLVPSGTTKEASFVTCYRSMGSTIGESSLAVPGVFLTVRSTGSAFNKLLSDGTGCSTP